VVITSSNRSQDRRFSTSGSIVPYRSRVVRAPSRRPGDGTSQQRSGVTGVAAGRAHQAAARSSPSPVGERVAAGRVRGVFIFVTASDEGGQGGR